MNTKFFISLLDWQEQGERCFEISVDAMNNNEIKIWLYDYNLQTGVFVKNIDDIPMDEDLIKKAKTTLQERINNLSI
jgi:hypothetical protein